jgi:hypothetical protein
VSATYSLVSRSFKEVNIEGHMPFASLKINTRSRVLFVEELNDIFNGLLGIMLQ